MARLEPSWRNVCWGPETRQIKHCGESGWDRSCGAAPRGQDSRNCLCRGMVLYGGTCGRVIKAPSRVPHRRKLHFNVCHTTFAPSHFVLPRCVENQKQSSVGGEEFGRRWETGGRRERTHLIVPLLLSIESRVCPDMRVRAGARIGMRD